MLVVQRSEKKEKSALKISVGLDVHKEKWAVAIYEDGELKKTYSQQSSVEVLVKHLRRYYEGIEIELAYEAGCCGFWIQRSLQKAGLMCMVVHAADIPSTDWDRRRKNDKLDARKIGYLLSRGLLKGIYIPSEDQEHLRNIVRGRATVGKLKRGYMSRIRAHLLRYGISLPQELKGKLWQKRGQAWLSEHSLVDKGLARLQKMYNMLRNEELSVLKMMHQELEQGSYSALYKYLLSIPGIGRCTAALLISELGDINRFKHLDHLASYCGLVPDVRSSAGREKVLGLSRRGNRRLRTALVESAWVAKRWDESLANTYSTAIEQGKCPQKAIVKVARRLLNRIRAVWKKGEYYQKGQEQAIKARA